MKKKTSLRNFWNDSVFFEIKGGWKFSNHPFNHSFYQFSKTLTHEHINTL